jgi:hypothetical protein
VRAVGHQPRTRAPSLFRSHSPRSRSSKQAGAGEAQLTAAQLAQRNEVATLRTAMAQLAETEEIGTNTLGCVQ